MFGRFSRRNRPHGAGKALTLLNAAVVEFSDAFGQSDSERRACNRALVLVRWDESPHLVGEFAAVDDVGQIVPYAKDALSEELRFPVIDLPASAQRAGFVEVAADCGRCARWLRCLDSFCAHKGIRHAQVVRESPPSRHALSRPLRAFSSRQRFQS